MTIAETIPLVGARKLLASHMTKSHLGIPAVTILEEWDVQALVDLKRKVAEESARNSQPQPSYTHLVIKALAQALQMHKFLNATITEEAIRIIADINIGFAVALPDDSLMVPVIRDADKKSIAEITAEANALTESARRGALRVEDIRGGTFTLTNIGVVAGSRWQTPLINSSQCAILAIGAIRDAPVVRDGNLAVGRVMSASLTFDHRIVSGVPASRFLRSLAGLFDGSVSIQLQGS
jgi:pyruvate dehydrogenase E2 component (dihydrolipoamide acetyltransferase)